MPAISWLENLSLGPATIYQLFYVSSSAAVLAIAALPTYVQQLLTQYGARNTLNSAKAEESRKPGSNMFIDFIAWFASVTKVPHSWFTHFYVLSVCCSAFWAIQYLSHGTLLELIIRNQGSYSQNSMTINQVYLTWFLMSLQGCRRLFECYAVMKPSSSRMLIVHWLLGVAFYLVTSMGIWVEGSRSLWYADRTSFRPETPSLKIIVGTPVFLFAWSTQHKCHRYLASLKKYSLPEGGLFQFLVCPHYFCECLLYSSLAVIGAPEGQWFNKTLVCAVIFIAVNLGVTAHGTREWYIEKFGREKVEGRWRMIPFVF